MPQLRTTRYPVRQLVLIADTTFEGEEGQKNQLGFSILMVYKNKKSNIIHSRKKKYSIIATYVTNMKVHSLNLGFDYAFHIKDQVEY